MSRVFTRQGTVTGGWSGVRWLVSAGCRTRRAVPRALSLGVYVILSAKFEFQAVLTLSTAAVVRRIFLLNTNFYELESAV